MNDFPPFPFDPFRLYSEICEDIVPWSQVANLPTVWLTPAPTATTPGGHTFPEIYTEGDTGGKFATDVNDACGQQ